MLRGIKKRLFEAAVLTVFFYHATLCVCAVLTVGQCPSVCLCVCLSVTLVYCVEMAKDTISLIAPSF